MVRVHKPHLLSRWKRVGLARGAGVIKLFFRIRLGCRTREEA